MKLLLDVHIGQSVRQALIGEGHDVKSVQEQDPQASDRTILGWAREEGRTIVTEDSDFARLVFAEGEAAPPGIIYLRCAPLRQGYFAPILASFLRQGSVESELIVIDQDTIRRRKFPASGKEHG